MNTMDLKIEQITEERRKPKPSDETQMVFGVHLTDHFFNMKWDRNKGWFDASLEPYHPFQMDPASLVFHYGQSFFEGIKAFYGVDHKVRIFRLPDYLKRFNGSARRLSMPEVDERFLSEAIRKLVSLERDWVPRSRGTALYMRPCMIASEASLGIKVSSQYICFVVACAVGPYYKEGFNPIKIWVSDDCVRAVRGGTGEAKAAGNYGGCLLAESKAAEQGYSQVLWLDAIERKYIEEVGSMNIFLVINDTIITPPLSGSILAGVTRDSILKIAPAMGYKTLEKRVSIDEITDWVENGSLKEAFGSGTAAVVSPIRELFYKGVSYNTYDDRRENISRRLFEEITAIQYGEKKDPYGWTEIV
jgi:branched-chain amino acid aminotransferase